MRTSPPLPQKICAPPTHLSLALPPQMMALKRLLTSLVLQIPWIWQLWQGTITKDTLTNDTFPRHTNKDILKCTFSNCLNYEQLTQLAFTCSKLTRETLWNMFKVNNKDTRTTPITVGNYMFKLNNRNTTTRCCRVSTVNFERVIAGWEANLKQLCNLGINLQVTIQNIKKEGRLCRKSPTRGIVCRGCFSNVIPYLCC